MHCRQWVIKYLRENVDVLQMNFVHKLCENGKGEKGENFILNILLGMVENCTLEASQDSFKNFPSSN